MVITRKYIPRRTFLRGAGAAVALPMLDAMTPAFADEAKRPIRMMFMQVPNGIMNLKNEFAPKEEGPAKLQALDKAKELYTRYAAGSDNPNAPFSLALFLARQGKVDDALEICDKAQGKAGQDRAA